MDQPLAPFSCSYSPTLPEILFDLSCTLSISTYQAGKVIFISATDREHVVQLARNVSKPMGIAIDKNRMAIATINSVLELRNSPAMAPNYPIQPKTYDALFLTRAQYFSGELDIHDLHFEGNKLWAVNTRFCCLSTIDTDYSFTPQWKPFFLTKLEPTDPCHLNGVAFKMVNQNL